MKVPAPTGSPAWERMCCCVLSTPLGTVTELQMTQNYSFSGKQFFHESLK